MVLANFENGFILPDATRKSLLFALTMDFASSGYGLKVTSTIPML